MAGFFGASGGETGGGSIDPSVLQTIVDARDAAVGAKASADAAVTQAQAAAAQAQVALGSIPDATTLQQQVQLSKDWANKVGTEVEPGLKSAKANAADAQTSAGNASSAATDAQTQAQAAANAAILADNYANAPPGTEVAPGKYSGAHQLNEITKAAVTVAKIPKKEITDALLTSGAYTLQQSDLNKYLVMLNTVAANVVLPAGLSTSLGPGGVPAMSFCHIVRRGAGAVSFSAGSGGAGLPASVLTEQSFTFSQITASAKAISHTVSVPAGNKRRIAVLLFLICDVGGVGSAVSLAATNTTAFTKSLADTSTGYFSNAAPLAAQWVGTMADSASATSVTVSGTLGNCLSYALWVVALKDTSGTTGSAGATTTAATTQAQALTPLEAGSVNLFGLAFQGSDALPLSLSSGTSSANTKTPGSRTGKDISFIFGYEARTNTTAVTYTGTTAKTSASGAHQGLVMRPDTTGGGTVTITGGGTPSLSAIGKHANVYVDTDGVTYDVETN